MEEDETKIRRNLVVFGALVCALTYLDGSLSIGLLSLIGVKVENPPLHKVLAIACCILLYLSLRYKFSEEGDAYQESVDSAIKRTRMKYAMRVVQNAVDKYHRTGIEPKVLAGQISIAIERSQERMGGMAFLNNPSGRKPIVTAELSAQKSPTLLEISIVLHPHADSKAGGFSLTGMPITLTHPQAFLARLKASFEVHMHSNQSVRFIVPLLLGNAAGMCLLYRAISLYVE